ncbi:hypothetical protein FW778_22425 [Ginsengibacter hankyongi]|uniref:DUF3592 domain-containing protein n=1 Tax=Ginsengibacter hankyongi TaxID=2607284 RepID=A0A5J5IBI9_9BACT|nr:DUF3592 domain-containing protein [Ginsengibacter hankyongi]KAA9034439.1 hypothetical protein FW778_22425 [Ginsengibacter hankyongi]
MLIDYLYKELRFAIMGFNNQTKELTFNKYIIYWLLMALLLGYSVIPKLYHTIVYKKTTGIIKYFDQQKYYSQGRIKYDQLPLVDFKVNNNTYEFYGNKYLRDAYYAGDTVQVIYDPALKGDAYINTFLGIWSPEVVYVLPTALIIFLIIGLDRIPQTIKIGF